MDSRKIILFDGVCNFCNSMVQFVIKHDRKNKFLFAPLQSETGQSLLKTHGIATDDFSSFVFVEGDKAYISSTAALKVTKHLHGPVKLLYGFIIVPPFIRNGIYRFIANNRYRWFGKKDSCMIPTPGLRSRFLN